MRIAGFFWLGWFPFLRPCSRGKWSVLRRRRRERSRSGQPRRRTSQEVLVRVSSRIPLIPKSGVELAPSREGAKTEAATPAHTGTKLPGVGWARLFAPWRLGASHSGSLLSLGSFLRRLRGTWSGLDRPVPVQRYERACTLLEVHSALILDESAGGEGKFAVLWGIIGSMRVRDAVQDGSMDATEGFMHGQVAAIGGGCASRNRLANLPEGGCREAVEGVTSASVQFPPGNGRCRESWAG